jgi:uncharacterized membrane protein
MYSRAKISGHPIHPALVAFPVAFYVGTLATLIAFQALRDPFWFHVAEWCGLAGVVMGAVAAIPGAIDLFSIPSHTRARQTAIAHGLLNVVTLLLFVVATITMWRQWRTPLEVTLDARLPLVLSAIGACTLIAAGTLGWKLVQTFHVGVTEQLPVNDLAPRTTLHGMGGELREPHHHTR